MSQLKVPLVPLLMARYMFITLNLQSLSASWVLGKPDQWFLVHQFSCTSSLAPGCHLVAGAHRSWVTIKHHQAPSRCAVDSKHRRARSDCKSICTGRVLEWDQYAGRHGPRTTTLLATPSLITDPFLGSASQTGNASKGHHPRSDFAPGIAMRLTTTVHTGHVTVARDPKTQVGGVRFPRGLAG